MITTHTRSHVATSSPHIFISLMQVGSVCSNSILHPLGAYGLSTALIHLPT